MPDSGNVYFAHLHNYFIISLLYIHNLYVDIQKYKNNMGPVCKLAMA